MYVSFRPFILSCKLHECKYNKISESLLSNAGEILPVQCRSGLLQGVSRVDVETCSTVTGIGCVERPCTIRVNNSLLRNVRLSFFQVLERSQ